MQPLVLDGHELIPAPESDALNGPMASVFRSGADQVSVFEHQQSMSSVPWLASLLSTSSSLDRHLPQDRATGRTDQTPLSSNASLQEGATKLLNDDSSHAPLDHHRQAHGSQMDQASTLSLRSSSSAKLSASPLSSLALDDPSLAPGAPQAHASCVVTISNRPSGPQGAAKQLLEHACMGVLPDDLQQLGWVLFHAHQAGLKHCVKACLDKLFVMLVLGNTHPLDFLVRLPEIATMHAALPAVARLVQYALASLLSDAHDLLLDGQLLRQFVQLPFPLVKQWATMPDLQVDSEETLVCLFTAWYDYQKQRPRLDLGNLEEQLAQLSALICLTRTTPSFHAQAIHHLQWYRPPHDAPMQHALARLLMNIHGFNHSSLGQTLLENPNVSSKRCYQDGDAKLQWRPAAKQLEQLCAHDSSVVLGEVYLAGFSVEVTARCVRAAAVSGGPSGSSYCLQFGFNVSWHHVLADHGLAELVPRPLVGLRVYIQIGARYTFKYGTIAGHGVDAASMTPAPYALFHSLHDLRAYLAQFVTDIRLSRASSSSATVPPSPPPPPSAPTPPVTRTSSYGSSHGSSTPRICLPQPPTTPPPSLPQAPPPPSHIGLSEVATRAQTPAQAPTLNGPGSAASAVAAAAMRLQAAMSEPQGPQKQWWPTFHQPLPQLQPSSAWTASGAGTTSISQPLPQLQPSSAWTASGAGTTSISQPLPQLRADLGLMDCASLVPMVTEVPTNWPMRFP